MQKIRPIKNTAVKIWLPYVVGGSGTDVFTLQLARNLRKAGFEAATTPVGHHWQYFPWRLRTLKPPNLTTVIITNTWNGFAFNRAGTKHITIAHHLVTDPANRPHRSFMQAVFHELLIRSFEKQSLRRANKVVAVSNYTARKLSEVYQCHDSEVIYNGIDTTFFSPGEKRPRRGFQMLYVGNLSKRKGADLLPRIMKRLGDGYHLSYTSGLRHHHSLEGLPNTSSLGILTQNELLTAYRDADILLFPSRLEGFGLACAEAMSCALPVVATNCSSLPEIIENGISGILCHMDDVEGFVAAVRKVSRAGQENLSIMGRRARESVVRSFDENIMSLKYAKLIDSLVHSSDGPAI